MENQYFRPLVEDLRVGYECELWDSWAYTKENWRKIVIGEQDDENSASYPYYDVFVDYADNICNLRTLYLTREQIEKEGWKYTSKSIDIWFEKEGMFDRENNYIVYKLKMHYNLQDKWLSINIDDRGEDQFIFNGKCKCINEFRIIMKLLNIK